MFVFLCCDICVSFAPPGIVLVPEPLFLCPGEYAEPPALCCLDGALLWDGREDDALLWDGREDDALLWDGREDGCGDDDAPD